MNGIYDVSEFANVGDGDDDSLRINRAIAFAKDRKGGVVWLPPGRYRVRSPIAVDEGMSLCGAGWTTNPNVGTWLYVDDTRFVPITVDAGGVVIRDLAIEHAQSEPTSGWRPREYPHAICIRSDDCTVQNILLRNPSLGILLDRPGKTTGRIILDRIWGQPLAQGIRIDNAQDVIRINDVHFWTFWTTNEIIEDYMLANAEGITSYRCDNPFLSNIFIFRYSKGIHFSRNANGPTKKFHLSNADLDICHTAIWIDGDETSGQISNLSCQGRANFATGLHVDAKGVSLQCSNVRSQTYANNCVRVSGTGTKVYFANLWVGDWNRGRHGFAAVEATNNAVIYIGKAGFDFDRGEFGGEGYFEGEIPIRGSVKLQ